MRWAVAGVRDVRVKRLWPRAAPAQPFAGHRAPGQQPAAGTRRRVPSRRDLAAFAGASARSRGSHQRASDGPGGQHDTPARRKEAVDPHHPDGSVRRERRTVKTGWTATGPTPSGGTIPAQVARRGSPMRRTKTSPSGVAWNGSGGRRVRSLRFTERDGHVPAPQRATRADRK